MNKPETNRPPLRYKARTALASAVVCILAVGIPTAATKCSGQNEPKLLTGEPRMPGEEMTPGNMKGLICLTLPKDMLRDLIGKEGASAIVIDSKREGGEAVIDFKHGTFNINGDTGSITDYCELEDKEPSS